MNAMLFKSLLVVLLAAGFVGCDTFEDIFDKEKEVSGLVEEVGEDYLVVEAIRYNVTDQTEYDGFTGLADIAVGVEVEIEYEESGNVRTAVEIEAGSDDN
jgi:hypothetical protein